jgi:hypothetical protein
MEPIMRTFALAVVFGIGMAPGTGAAEQPDLVPLVEPPAVFVSPPSFYRPSRWDVWQYYGVDRTGHWRPRVILGPEPFYLYNGAPYHTFQVRPRDYMPFFVD